MAAGCLHPSQEPVYEASIRRTAGGIPHIRADDLGSLGFGTLYAMAEDNHCILADHYLTLAAERARHLGAENGNLESDLFYQFLIDRGDAARPLPEDLEQLFAGAAAGYNHYLRTASLGNELPEAGGDPRCAGASWLRAVEAIDVKRVSRVDYALAYMRPIIIAAAPPESDEVAHLTSPSPLGAGRDLVAVVEAYLDVPKQGGSNGVAIGRAASLNGTGLLLANPHMPWNEPFQRFYPMHQTIPGEFDVVGANLIGRPRVGFGHSAHVAWTSTVSTAKRLSFYRLDLDPSDPTRYLFDGESIAMTPHRVTVSTRTPSGQVEDRTHTFYETHFGGLLVESEFFGWTEKNAFAVRLLDADWRGETSLLDQYRARSVHELKAVHDRDQFLPVNLVAADRQGEVLYADPGPIPNLPDDLVSACAVLGGAALDGTRSECQWRDSPGAVVPGIFAPDELPWLVREDYVTNSNDSYWLANPASPIEERAKTLGSVETPRTLRTRSGLEMLAREIDREGGVTLDGLRALALSNENYAGQLIRDDVVALCAETPEVTIDGGRVVSLNEACRVLAEWDLRANLESRGAPLFRQFLAAANGGRYTRELPDAFAPASAFDPTNPVATPRGLARSANQAVLESLASAVVSLTDVGIALDAALGDLQGVRRNGDRIPLHGGPEFEGIFNKIEADFRGADGYPDVDRWSSSWILAVEFAEEGPRTYGILTYSLSANPGSPHFADQTRLYSQKRWLELPFHHEDIEAATDRAYTVRAERSSFEAARGSD
jgi:acyl-homoserine-lactone acylase